MDEDSLRLRLALNKSVLSTTESIESFACERFDDDERAKRISKRARIEVLRAGCLSSFAVTEDGGTLSAKCHSVSSPEQYVLSVHFQPDGCKLACNCPAAQKDPLCKHGLALLLWRVPHLQPMPAAPPPSSAASPELSAGEPQSATPSAAPACAVDPAVAVAAPLVMPSSKPSLPRPTAGQRKVPTWSSKPAEPRKPPKAMRKPRSPAERGSGNTAADDATARGRARPPVAAEAGAERPGAGVGGGRGQRQAHADAQTAAAAAEAAGPAVQQGAERAMCDCEAMAAATSEQLRAQCDALLPPLQLASSRGACPPAHEGHRKGKRKVCAALAAESLEAPGGSGRLGLVLRERAGSAGGVRLRAPAGAAAGRASPSCAMPEREPGAAATPANPVDLTGGDSDDETPTGLVAARAAGAPPLQGLGLGPARGSRFEFADADTQPMDELQPVCGAPESAELGPGLGSAPGSGAALGPAATLPIGDLPPELEALRARLGAPGTPAAPMQAAAAAPRAPLQQAAPFGGATSLGWADANGATELPWRERKRARPVPPRAPDSIDRSAPASGPTAGALLPARTTAAPAWPLAAPKQAEAALAGPQSAPDQVAAAPAWPAPAPSQAAGAGKARNPLEDLLGFSLE